MVELRKRGITCTLVCRTHSIDCDLYAIVIAIESNQNSFLMRIAVAIDSNTNNSCLFGQTFVDHMPDEVIIDGIRPNDCVHRMLAVDSH